MFFIVDLYRTKKPHLGQKTSFGGLFYPSSKAKIEVGIIFWKQVLLQQQ